MKGSGSAALHAGIRIAVSIVACAVALVARAEGDAVDTTTAAAFSFAVVGTGTRDERATGSLLRAVGDGPSRFVVHFDLRLAAEDACADPGLERRRALLNASPRPAVPVVAAVEWADCPGARGDPTERLERVADLYFGSDESLGQARMPWVRQSAVARFKRYRENLRWQSGRILFATINLPADNNGFRFGAGRNGEFEERLVANRAWLERTFRLAQERRLAGVVLFIDGAPRFASPLRAPDNRLHERDGFYEFKVVLRDLVAAFHGKVLLFQGQWAGAGPRPTEVDHPLRDAGGKTLDNLLRIPVPRDSDERDWLQVDVGTTDRALFRVVRRRVFDDPSGELYGLPSAR